jgi:hypothetical protein
VRPLAGSNVRLHPHHDAAANDASDGQAGRVDLEVKNPTVGISRAGCHSTIIAGRADRISPTLYLASALGPYFVSFVYFVVPYIHALRSGTQAEAQI